VKSRVKSSITSDGSPQNLSCPICCACDVSERKQGRDRLFGQADGWFNLFRCKSCGCVFQNPFPEDEELKRFYPREYWWTAREKPKSRLEGLLRKLEKIYREFVVADHVRFLNYCARHSAANGKSLLDIGCGSGTFLHVARTRGFVPHGMDMSSRAVELACAQYGYPVLQGDIGSGVWKDHRFDFVTMFHVLEHLSDPRDGLRYVRELLRPTGVLIIQVPNASSIQARLFGSLWYGFDVPRHVINYTPKALGLLLREMRFEFHLTSRFSLRDNPASIASTIVPWLDPIRRNARRNKAHPLLGGAMDIAYFSLILLALPAAFIESACGFGGTIWARAWPKKP
jgi:2-polyprenyl-3-methyl-5-hydroxy-6-metoxy-1,4-benzoquinol methylase